MYAFFMNDLKEVTSKSTIDFPENLSLEQSEDLLKYLAENLPADIDYQISQHKSKRHIEKEVGTIEGTLEITGQIISRNNFLGCDSFTMANSDLSSEYFKIGRLEFSRVSGGDLNEYGGEVKELWDSVRERVGDYFESSSD